jgi:hypothetical protein
MIDVKCILLSDQTQYNYIAQGFPPFCVDKKAILNICKCRPRPLLAVLSGEWSRTLAIKIIVCQNEAWFSLLPLFSFHKHAAIHGTCQSTLPVSDNPPSSFLRRRNQDTSHNIGTSGLLNTSSTFPDHRSLFRSTSHPQGPSIIRTKTTKVSQPAGEVFYTQEERFNSFCYSIICDFR